MIINKKVRELLDKLVVEYNYVPPQKFAEKNNVHLSINYIGDNSDTKCIFFLWYNTISRNYELVNKLTLNKLVNDWNFINVLVLLMISNIDLDKLKEITKEFLWEEYKINHNFSLKVNLKKLFETSIKNETKILKLFEKISDNI